MDEFVQQVGNWLFRWQPLVGAALGVMGAFAVAWWASSHSGRRERRNAAIELMQELTEYAAVTETMLEGGGTKIETDFENLSKRQAAALSMVLYRPKLTPAFVSNTARLRMLDAVLVTRLSAVRRAYEAAEKFFDRLEEAERLKRLHGDPGYDEDAIRGMLNSAASLSQTVITEARDAAKDLENLFTVRWSWLRRFALGARVYQRRRIKRFKEERDAKRDAKKYPH